MGQPEAICKFSLNLLNSFGWKQNWWLYAQNQREDGHHSAPFLPITSVVRAGGWTHISYFLWRVAQPTMLLGSGSQAVI